MIDFTSSLYLNMKHSSRELPEWQQLTTGVPAALYETNTSKLVGNHIAAIQGLEAGITSPSTMHLYWDLFGLIAKQQCIVFIDEKVYPVSNYGIEKLIAANIKVYRFRHLCADNLERMVKAKLTAGATPVVLTDGWCTACGRHAPLKDYVNILKDYNGTLIIDDTQAFGILGERKPGSTAYGQKGNGILKWLNVKEHNIITAISIAKAFGVPMAIMSCSKSFAGKFTENSKTRVNSSPASNAHVSAAINALQINKRDGDALRVKLYSNVFYFKEKMKLFDVCSGGGIFPVQSISYKNADKTLRLFSLLKRNGIEAVLTAPHAMQQPWISFLIRCDHSYKEIDRICRCLQQTPLIQTSRY